jgi:hypothetical protein
MTFTEPFCWMREKSSLASVAFCDNAGVCATAAVAVPSTSAATAARTNIARMATAFETVRMLRFLLELNETVMVGGAARTLRRHRPPPR